MSSGTPGGLTVVIPVRNAERWIGQALDSVLRAVPGSEVVVVDDGSTDRSVQIAVEGFPGARVLRLSSGGVSRARNVGLCAATTEWVAFLDADDRLTSEFGRCLDLLDGGVDVLVCGGSSVDGFGRTRWTWLPPTALQWDREVLGRFLPGQVIFRRTFLAELGGYDETLRFGENTELGLRVMSATDRVRTVQLVSCVRLHRYRFRAYGRARSDSARRVLIRHPELADSVPALWADYHRIAGVDDAERGDYRSARRHFREARTHAPDGTARLRSAAVRLPGARRVAWRRERTQVRVAVVCPGANVIRRGYESYAKGLSQALQGHPDLNVELVGGGRPEAAWERRLPRLSASTPAAGRVARVLGVAPRSAEQYAFGLVYLLDALRSRPDVVVVSERPLANVLSVARRTRLLRYSVLFHNGGSGAPPFDRFDLVQQVTPSMYEAALAGGEPPDRHVLLPEGLDLALLPERRPAISRRPTVISVGLMDVQTKGMDRLVRAVATLRPQPALVVLGDRCAESDEVIELAKRLLEPHSYSFDTVPAHEVAGHLAEADCFALASPREGFGRAYIEAQAVGLPVVADDNPHTRWLLGDGEYFADASDPEALAAQISRALSEVGSRAPRRSEALARFDWSVLREAYVEMILASNPETSR